jgi:hypothetical protein
MKIITMCGSLIFQSDIMRLAEKLALDGNCVLSPIYPTTGDKDAFTQAQCEILKAEHLQKIDISDAIFVVNKDGYIGDSVKNEIEYARAHNKEILFAEEMGN